MGASNQNPEHKTRHFSSNRRRLCALLPAPVRTECRLCCARSKKAVFADFLSAHRRSKRTLSLPFAGSGVAGRDSLFAILLRSSGFVQWPSLFQQCEPCSRNLRVYHSTHRRFTFTWAPLLPERLVLRAVSSTMDSGLRIEDKEVDISLVSESMWQFTSIGSVLIHAAMVCRALHVAWFEVSRVRRR